MTTTGIGTGTAAGDSSPRRYPVQLLQPDGRRVLDREFRALIADVDAEELIELYADMVAVRRLDTEATALQRQGELGLWTPSLGQEAAQVGSAHALGDADYVFDAYREHGVAYCRGVDPGEMTALWRGAAHAGWDPAAVNMTNPALVVGSQALHATGYAYAAQLDGAEIATVVYFGDGATSQGDVAEAMVFAASWSAPVVFVCVNNHWAISAPVGVQAAAPIADRALGYGIPAVRVDGNDVLAVLAVTRAAARRAREGGGPSFIEAITYRMGPHATSDDPTRYRDSAEVDLWAARDPLARVLRLLEREGLRTTAVDDMVRARGDAAAARIRAVTLAMPDPEPMTLFEHVYATPHAPLARQRGEYARYLAESQEVQS
ncbi:pyruvate dehydrogenase (acetyl-transferring) E1 component subunit alpha [Nocardia acidivorans]|uniref:pyruvate dehydrogenase (acetyl-transferring) E1 component subunit alpha n=1 Tax=Nocardia acidivorans TaxID=404580 RepID=UPI0008303148|nr:pyruvate dehydrogenase (acetyl-transferring) E1 component subunit alpha [Nocardia acidivorans]